MKFVIMFALCIVSCLAVPYSVSFETPQIKEHEEGVNKNLGDREGPVNVKKGYFEFEGPDRKTYHEDWTADEQGFLAKGDHLPTSPPLPQVKRSVK